MPRPRLSLPWIVSDGITELYSTLKRQKPGSALLPAFFVSPLAMVFWFLAVFPILFPLVYLLF